MSEKCVLTIPELSWNQRLGHKETKLNICHHVLTSSTQLQNWSFHLVERTRTSTKCQKLKKCTCKACKNGVFHCQICKLVGFLLPSSSWLLKLPNNRVGKYKLKKHQFRNKTKESGTNFRYLVAIANSLLVDFGKRNCPNMGLRKEDSIDLQLPSWWWKKCLLWHLVE